MNLTPAQRRAINHRAGNLQLIACAGSGKTEVVARYVANLLKPDLGEALFPRNIIAFTYTDKAAAELKERVTPAAGRNWVRSMVWPRCTWARYMLSVWTCSRPRYPSS